MPTDMLKSLVPQVIASVLAASVGGWITYFALTKNTENRSVMHAYESYLSEAVRAMTIAQKEQLAKEDILRLGGASAVLTIYGSREVMCRAMNFERCIEHGVEKGREKYGDLAETIRAELLGEVTSRKPEECAFPPQDPTQGECPWQ